MLLSRIIFLLLLLSSVFTIAVAETDTLVEITSIDELQAYFDNQTNMYKQYGIDEFYDEFYNYRYYDRDYVLTEEITSNDVYAASELTTREADEYSTTNVQVEGIDEADFVKNDGKYIYLIKDNNILITEVYPPENGKIVCNMEIDGNIKALFLNGDKLVIFKETREDKNDYVNYCNAVIYDITDRANPKQIKEITIPGYYNSGRMDGSNIYLLTKAYFNPKDLWMPEIIEDGKVTTYPEVWCPQYPIIGYAMYTLSSIDIETGDLIDSSSFLSGSDSTFYLTSDNAYIACQKVDPVLLIFTIVDDIDEAKTIIETLTGQEISKENITERSSIYKFDLTNGILYNSSGYIPGSLLNQFSLDEQGGYLRVATTKELTTGETSNNVYILKPDLTITGKLEDLAKGEKIYSARFMGDLLYLVTFKKMDPLFVIDLKDPEKPKVLGELKIPGYSDYLHPYGDDKLIGVGKDTDDNGIATGVKIALFDVSDINNPKEIDKRIIGEAGSSSSVLSDHKAFLLDKGRNLIALPINENKKYEITDSDFSDSYLEGTWAGTYLYEISDNGFIDYGKIEQEPVSSRSYWSQDVTRSIIMDDVIYTLSDNRIIGSEINTLDRLMKLELTKTK